MIVAENENSLELRTWIFAKQYARSLPRIITKNIIAPLLVELLRDEVTEQRIFGSNKHIECILCALKVCVDKQIWRFNRGFYK